MGGRACAHDVGCQDDGRIEARKVHVGARNMKRKRKKNLFKNHLYHQKPSHSLVAVLTVDVSGSLSLGQGCGKLSPVLCLSALTSVLRYSSPLSVS